MENTYKCLQCGDTIMPTIRITNRVKATTINPHLERNRPAEPLEGVHRCKCNRGVFTEYQKTHKCIMSNGKFDPIWLAGIPKDKKKKKYTYFFNPKETTSVK